METKRIDSDISSAARIIRAGGLVAVPTETVYGLAGNGLDEKAVEEIYEVKGRPAVKPLSLMVPDAGAMQAYCEEVPPAAYTLAEKFWPGPLTIVLKSRDIVPDIVRAGGETVGLRCPDHPLTLELLRKAQKPLAAPSANPSGAPSPKTAGEVLAYFDGKIDAVIDGGPCGLGRESTIIDLTQMPYRILRQGALPEADIDGALIGGMTVIGITGGTGSGKTTALNALEKQGALIIDCDAVYHEMLETDAQLLSGLRQAFPSAFADGGLNRKALGKIVFSDKAALAALNSIAHKHIDRRVTELLAAFARRGGRVAAIDAVALVESGVSGKCALVVGVAADREARLARIMARDGISREYALLRIDAQPGDAYYAEVCDKILENRGSQAEFQKECEKYFTEVIKNGGKNGK